MAWWMDLIQTFAIVALLFVVIVNSRTIRMNAANIRDLANTVGMWIGRGQGPPPGGQGSGV